MKFITDTCKRRYGKVDAMFAMFECENCNREFEIVKYNGKRQIMCRECSLAAKHKKLSITLTKHGGRNTRLYKIWSSAKDRCFNHRSNSYINYGNRGITMCVEWKTSFETFREWALCNGYNDLLTIDRINNDGNYEPNNCRWVDMSIQSLNKRNTVVTLEQMEDIKNCSVRNISYSDVCKKYKHISKKVISNHYYKKDNVDKEVIKIKDYTQELNSILEGK